MTLKLSKLPKRTPVRISATFPPEIHAALIDYAHIYEQNYGVKEKIEDLVPYIIASFLDTDNGFKKARRQLAATSKPTPRPPKDNIGNLAREGDK
ncbi:DUF2274 domain-containing protein [Paremcibacter congregatus]|uniref:DUF2274 domain-containing protein n=1 Tax=Paremcibacter congregatus TaxID=2043170 RepID=UPI0030EB412A|tara:strand:+ start:2591 stop:2875 length:285 start_codon:yes stop_codon:yes gene_type:complete